MQVGENITFPLEILFLPEIDEVANLLSSDSHVVEELGFVLGGKFGDRLEFHGDAFEHDKIWYEMSRQLMLFVDNFEFRLRKKRDAAQAQLDLKTLLVDLLGHAIAELVVHFDAAPIKEYLPL